MFNLKEFFESDEITFMNDNNVKIKLLKEGYNKELTSFIDRPIKEKIFRKINTYLILNNIIKNNIIDLGAWIGDNSIPWAMNINSTIYAIDPSEENCNFIKEMCNLNKINNVKVIQSAISDKNEILTTNDDMFHVSFVYNNKNNNGKNKLNAVTLDYLYNNKEIENIGYIHLDVEGMELRILQGAINIVNNYRPIVTFEQHIETENYDDILKYFTSRNYKVFLIEEVAGNPDCRNSIAFPIEIYNEDIIKNLTNIVGENILIPK
jgi:FkbM family methyltransferase